MTIAAKAGATALLLVMIAAFISLGRWQWDVAHSNPAGEPLTGVRQLTQTVPLEDFVPLNAIGATVEVTGTLRPDLMRLVPYRNVSGRSGDSNDCWEVQPLDVGNGIAATVVTGVVTCNTARDLSGTPARQTIRGILQPPDVHSATDRGQAPAAQFLPSVSTDLLVNEWPFQLYDGYVVVAPITPLTPNPPGTRLDLRNAAYALQWWFFAFFAVAVWWRAIRPQDPMTVSVGSQEQNQDHEVR